MIKLAPLFQAVEDALRRNQSSFNQSDLVNGNHGDHMVAIFELAASAAQEREAQPLADAMGYAGAALGDLVDNGSAQVYAHGLQQFANQFEANDVSTADLVNYVQNLLGENGRSADEGPPSNDPADGGGGDVLKALMAGLANWRSIESAKEPEQNPLDVGYLFDLGVAYMGAKARGGSKTKIIADAAVSVSPLNDVPHRAESGRLAIQTLLEAMQLE